MPELGLFQNIWVNLSFVIGFTVMAVWILNRIDAINWRLVDFCALVLGAVGFLVPAFEVQRTAFEIEASAQRGWTGGELSGLEIVTKAMLGNCRPFMRSELSPPDFDLLVEESRLVCLWAEELNNFVNTLSQDNYREIPSEIISSFPAVREVPVGYHKERFLEFINDWNAHVRERRDVDEMARGGAPLGLILFSPYLLALAFSLAAAGVLFKPKH